VTAHSGGVLHPLPGPRPARAAPSRPLAPGAVRGGALLPRAWSRRPERRSPRPGAGAIPVRQRHHHRLTPRRRTSLQMIDPNLGSRWPRAAERASGWFPASSSAPRNRTGARRVMRRGLPRSAWTIVPGPWGPMVDEASTSSRPDRPRWPNGRPAFGPVNRTPRADIAGAFAAVRRRGRRPGCGKPPSDRRGPPPGDRSPNAKNRGEHPGPGNQSLTLDPPVFPRLVHAIVGIRPRPPERAVRSPTIAWTIEPGEFRARWVDERLRRRPVPALGAVVLECGRPELAARRRARLGAGTRPRATPTTRARAMPGARARTKAGRGGAGDVERGTGGNA
jgi:hypothetical protein